MSNVFSMVSLIEMISAFSDLIGPERFERGELEDDNQVDKNVQDVGYQYNEEVNAYVKQK